MGKEYIVDVADALALAFGQRLNLYKLTPDQQQTVITLSAEAQGDGLGLLGLPIFQMVALTDPSDTIANTLHLNDCLVDVNLPRNIVKTPVVGKDGTVKEFISNGDFDISIKGLFINQAHPDKIPEVQMRSALRWFQKGKALGVEGKIFDILGISNIVIEHVSMPQIPTFIGMRPFELKCVSDTAFVIGANTSTIDINNNV